LFSMVALRDRAESNHHLFALPSVAGVGTSFRSSPLSQ
jgi:hypothetical protein